MGKQYNSNDTNKRHKVRNGVLCLLALCIINVIFGATPPKQAKGSKIKPTIPTADRYQKGRVFLEYADSLTMDEKKSTEYQVLNGNVKFRKGDMYMYCDSAHFYDKRNSLYAFGNVKMEQGDTLFVYADQLYYNGDIDLAQLRYNVRMENRNVTLFADSLDYVLLANIGYYFEGGKIVDEETNSHPSTDNTPPTPKIRNFCST